MINILNEIGTSVCHQEISRSFFIQGQLLPICSRCTGIYLGAFLTYIFFLFPSGRKRSGLPSKSIIYILIIFITLMGLDAVSAGFLELRKTNNYIRLATGFLTGIAMVSFLYPISNYILWKHQNNKSIFSKNSEFIGLLFYIFTFYMLIILGWNWLFRIAAVFSILGIIILYLNINLIILILIAKKDQKTKKIMDLIFFIPGTIVLSFFELYLLRLYHLWLRA